MDIPFLDHVQHLSVEKNEWDTSNLMVACHVSPWEMRGEDLIDLDIAPLIGHKTKNQLTEALFNPLEVSYRSARCEPSEHSYLFCTLRTFRIVRALLIYPVS
jgi:hypothetical protein